MDLSDLTNPVLVGYGVGPSTDVQIRGSYVYGINGANGVHVIDVSDPTTLAEVAYSKHPGWSHRLAIIDSYILVANDEDGLATLWFSPSVTATIPTSGGSLISPIDHTTYNFPANTFSAPVEVTHTPRYPYALPLPESNLRRLNHMFDVNAIYSDTGLTAQPEPGKTYSINLVYEDDELGVISESTLSFYSWDDTQWQVEPSDTDIHSNTITVTPSHLGTWVIFGQTNSIYLPLANLGLK